MDPPRPPSTEYAPQVARSTLTRLECRT